MRLCVLIIKTSLEFELKKVCFYKSYNRLDKLFKKSLIYKKKSIKKEKVLRVTAGKYKGRVLEENKFEHIRPTADMVKQAIFNKINFDLQGAKVLDLFCGTGALGIEAISRGASEVVFADKDVRSISLTIKNLNKLGLTARVLNATYQNAIKRLSGEKFDIIILDPPYKSGLYEDCVKLIYQSDLLNENGIIVCEQNKEDEFDFSPFETIDIKVYGIKKVCYLKLNKSSI